VLIERLSALPDLLALQAADPARFPLLLESVASGTPRARYDLLLAGNGEGLRLDADGRLHDFAGTERSGDFLAALDADFAAQTPLAPPSSALPFFGGWALYLAYELVGQIEPCLRLPPGPEGLPVALALRCPVAIVIDHQDHTAWLVGESGQTDLFARVQAAIRVNANVLNADVASAELDEDRPEEFIKASQRVIDYLAAGDVFQVNLSRGWTATFAEPPAPHALYQRLRDSNPAPFAGLLRQPDWTLLSSSPERLVSRRGTRIETRPIAGTRPRLAGDDDAARMRELVDHPKERAEHIMLIDLERNDLGRVCEVGSVTVDALMEVESYAHVHHIESTVSGIARDGVSPGDLIRAMFPGGTITGCPKVRCMQIIAELEGVGRGPYTGAIGWLDRSGDLDLNILIRSAWLMDDRLSLRAGAGIVIDSDPEHELHETRAKARGLLQALLPRSSNA